MNPTQYELATLAATFTGGGTPEQRVKAALEIWKACGEKIEAAARISTLANEKDRQTQEVKNLFAGRSTVPFEEFLKHLMPDQRPEDRARRYRSYLRWNVRMCDEQAGHKARSEADLENAVSEIIRRDKSDGIYPNGFAERVKKIREVVEFEVREALSNRGKKGQQARLEAEKNSHPNKTLGGKTKAKKTPQAKRAKRQAKD